ncbi:hypothetical protein Nmel_017566 [Mimus melanotis]
MLRVELENLQLRKRRQQITALKTSPAPAWIPCGVL